MPLAPTTLIAPDQRQYTAEFFHEDPTGGRIDKWTIRGGPGDGIDVVELAHPDLSVSVLPTRGMGIWKAQSRDLPIGWQSPVRRPVHPSLVRVNESGGIGWLGAFHELVARCGLAWHGPPATDPEDGRTSTLHGRIANIPAHEVSVGVDDNGRTWVRGVVEETSLFGECLQLTSVISVTPGSTCITIEDTVTNLAGIPSDLELLYHTNIGAPILEAGSRLSAPARRVIPATPHAASAVDAWDHIPAPTSGFVEQCYFLELAPGQDHRTLVVLHDASARHGVALGFDLTSLPHFTIWKNAVAAEDGYVVGIEPSTDLPNPRHFERNQGRLMRLPAGAAWTTRLELQILADASAVSDALAVVESIGRGIDTIIEPAPRTTHTAGLAPEEPPGH